tara:strand:- start:74 stop:367 length:294 start_codon:yes stop_codon:yes gene_type:complete
MSEIIWSPTSKKDFRDNIHYLENTFTETEIINFTSEVERVLKIISLKPKTFQKTDYKKVHFVVIVPQITLYYRILDKTKVELVRFWNNSKDPLNLSL